MFWFQLAACVGRQERAGIEPVDGACGAAERRKRSAELWIVWAPAAPQGISCRQFVEAQDLFYAAIAVRGDDDDPAWERRAGRQSQEEIVVELTLLPMVQELVAPASGAERSQEGVEAEV